MNRIWRGFIASAATCCFLAVALTLLSARAGAVGPDAATDTAMPALSRQDRLLLLDNVARLWQLGITGIGTEEPYNSGDSSFGLVSENQLDPGFIQAQSLVLTIHFGANGQVARLAPEEMRPSQAHEQEALFKNIPQRFTRYYPYAALGQAALSYLGWPHGPFNPQEGVLKTEHGLYVDLDWWYGPTGPMEGVKRDTAFATAFTDYPDNDGWGMEGQVRQVAPGDDTILRVADRVDFHLRARKIGANWRIHALIFVPQQTN